MQQFLFENACYIEVLSGQRPSVIDCGKYLLDKGKYILNRILCMLKRTQQL